MRNTQHSDLSDRRSASADARAALLQAFRDRREAAEPTRLAREEERLIVAAARDERRAARDRAKIEERERQQEQKRIAAEAVQRQAAADAEATAKAKAEARDRSDELIARVIKDEAARKADRDRRYAGRKARQQ